MGFEITSDFLAAGGNRHPSAADWKAGLLAFGAGSNLAIWQPNAEPPRKASRNLDEARGASPPLPSHGICALLAGHTDAINAVQIYQHPRSDRVFLLSGGADHSVRIWEATAAQAVSNAGLRAGAFDAFVPRTSLGLHSGAVNVIAVLPSADLFVSGGADARVQVCGLKDEGTEVRVLQTIVLTPRFLPLACALTQLEGGAVVLAVAGTRASISLYVRGDPDEEFVLQANLVGHEGWVRSLDFTFDRNGDLLLASASQDKYIRLWRFRRDSSGVYNDENATNGNLEKKSLSNRAQQVGVAERRFEVTFEALLIGHEDWIYTAKWSPTLATGTSPFLLSASADNSLSIWNADESSGLWVCHTRLGEISAQKGSTTATGSMGGFWIGLWQPDSQAVMSLSRTGSWRRWDYSLAERRWKQEIGICGHTDDVRSIAWAPDGSYLLSTGSDQTTRVFAQWKRGDQVSWHEFARPQIHGYDLNCIDSTTTNQFVSGADEKLLRVFNKPKAIDELLHKLCGLQLTTNGELPDTANIPVLGLSNKAVAPIDGTDNPEDQAAEYNGSNADIAQPQESILDFSHPPLEDHLSRHTLWPEHEKLYGHGNEICALAANKAGTLIATACKASTSEHAVIRLYVTREWREVKPPLTAHSLTVTSLKFSPDDRYLLSVGRDRQWAVFARVPGDDASASSYALAFSNPKGHTRMILDCAWAPTSSVAGGYIFTTAGRDKCVKLWRFYEGAAEVECVWTYSAPTPITTVDFAPIELYDTCLAFGTEEGEISLAWFDKKKWETRDMLVPTLPPVGAINALQWRPSVSRDRVAHLDVEGEDLECKTGHLAVASEDSSVRIYAFREYWPQST